MFSSVTINAISDNSLNSNSASLFALTVNSKRIYNPKMNKIITAIILIIKRIMLLEKKGKKTKYLKKMKKMKKLKIIEINQMKMITEILIPKIIIIKTVKITLIKKNNLLIINQVMKRLILVVQ